MNPITKKTWTSRTTIASKDEILEAIEKILSDIAYGCVNNRRWDMKVRIRDVMHALHNEAMEGNEQKVQILATWEDIHDMLLEISRQRCFRGGPTGFLNLYTRPYPGKPNEKQFSLDILQNCGKRKNPRNGA
jgi:hypothetical protein